MSCWNPFDHYGEEYDRAADKFFGSDRRPTIDETVAYYRQQKIGLVMFTVDSEAQLGRRRIPNEEIAEAARKNADMMICFGSIDPHKGKMGAREARRLIAEHGVKGFKFPPRSLPARSTGTIACGLTKPVARHALRHRRGAGSVRHRPAGAGQPWLIVRRIGPATARPAATASICWKSTNAPFSAGLEQPKTGLLSNNCGCLSLSNAPQKTP